MADYFKPPRGTLSAALQQNIKLKNGEIFFEVPDTGPGSGPGKIKMGDGETEYANLPYFISVPEDVSDLYIDFINSTEATGIENNPTYLNNISPGSLLKNIFTNLKQLLVNFNSEITENETNISNLTSRVSTDEGRITNLIIRMTTAEGKITTDEGKITSLEGRMTTAEGKINTNRELIDTTNDYIDGELMQYITQIDDKKWINLRKWTYSSSFVQETISIYDYYKTLNFCVIQKEYNTKYYYDGGILIPELFVNESVSVLSLFGQNTNPGATIQILSMTHDTINKKYNIEIRIYFSARENISYTVCLNGYS